MKLKGCPFCGAEPMSREARPDGTRVRRAKAWCFGEYGATPGHQAEAYGNTDAELEATWNTRIATKPREVVDL